MRDAAFGPRPARGPYQRTPTAPAPRHSEARSPQRQWVFSILRARRVETTSRRRPAVPNRPFHHPDRLIRRTAARPSWVSLPEPKPARSPPPPTAEFPVANDASRTVNRGQAHHHGLACAQHRDPVQWVMGVTSYDDYPLQVADARRWATSQGRTSRLWPRPSPTSLWRRPVCRQTSSPNSKSSVRRSSPWIPQQLYEDITEIGRLIKVRRW